MATLNQIYALRYSTTGVFHRATASVMKLADYILTTEPANAANHANRVTWAHAAAADPEAKARQIMNSLAVNGTVAGEYNPAAPDEGVPDADIDYVVGVSVDLYATGV
jgi:hypothetical protein